MTAKLHLKYIWVILKPQGKLRGEKKLFHKSFKLESYELESYNSPGG